MAATTGTDSDRASGFRPARESGRAALAAFCPSLRSVASAFGLLGLGGLDPFIVTIDGYEEWSELQPRTG